MIITNDDMNCVPREKLRELNQYLPDLRGVKYIDACDEEKILKKRQVELSGKVKITKRRVK